MGESSKDSARQDASSLPVLRREVFECTTHDMCTLTMWRCFAAPTAPTRKHSVVLCHGLASNRFTFDLQADVSVVDYLAEQGWDTWLVELRG
ncbi:hypothetical protein T484DRAFT_3470631 [Baffinella frigidus]|nr:hypothetical protein T484DRAFT_3470631 [Cryptophyta sp. CCMP2293]